MSELLYLTSAPPRGVVARVDIGDAGYVGGVARVGRSGAERSTP